MMTAVQWMIKSSTGRGGLARLGARENGHGAPVDGLVDSFLLHFLHLEVV